MAETKSYHEQLKIDRTTEENRSYTSFVANNGVATITALAGNKTTKSCTIKL